MSHLHKVSPSPSRPLTEELKEEFASERRKDRLTSLQRHDYRRWDAESVRKFNPTKITSRPNPSYSLHPKCTVGPDFFKSLKQISYQDHHVAVRPPPPAFPPLAVPPFEETTLYRQDFVPHAPKRPQTAQVAAQQAAAVKRPTKFEHNSTYRAELTDPHATIPKRVHPTPKLHFSFQAPINTTYRAAYSPANAGMPADGSPRRAQTQRFHVDQGWRNGLNRDDGDTYVSLSRHDYVNDAEYVPRDVRLASCAIDREVVRRNKLHEDFADVE